MSRTSPKKIGQQFLKTSLFKDLTAISVPIPAGSPKSYTYIRFVTIAHI